MGMRPVFECPDNLLERLPEVCAARSVRVEMVKEVDVATRARPYVIYCAFKWRLGRIRGGLSHGGKARRMWLTTPGAHAINPLLWPVDLRLTKKIERLLVENGARRCSWDDGENGF